MKLTITAIFGLLLVVSCTTGTTDQNVDKSFYETTGEIERIDDRINQLIPQNAKIEVIASGFNWSEGPLWLEEEGFLIFSDVPENTIYKWSEQDSISVYLKPSGYTGVDNGEGSNGLLLDSNGQLVICQHGDRRMARMMSPLNNPDPGFETIISQYEGKKFNSPNDAVYDSKGNLYFTDPPYGLAGQDEDPAKEIEFQGVFRYSIDGELTLLSADLTRPNGAALSPDEKTLYIANSDPQQSIWVAYNLSEEGRVVEKKIFYDATGAEGKGLPDGMKTDRHGNLWATGPGGVWIFNPEGELLGKIKTGEATANCAFNKEQNVLYMTCDDYLMRIKLSDNL